MKKEKKVKKKLNKNEKLEFYENEGIEIDDEDEIFISEQNESEEENQSDSKKESNENSINEEEENESEDDNDKEPRIGLEKINATFYMNATIQCFSKTKKLTDFFLAPNNQYIILYKIENNNYKSELTTTYYEVIKNLWDKKNKKGYNAINFKEKLIQMNQLFKGYNPGCPKDLIDFILNRLHEELNKKDKYHVTDENNKKDKIYYQYDRNQMINMFIEEYKRDYKSIISDLFFGISENISECINCKKRNKEQGLKMKYKYDFQVFHYLVFPLEEVRYYRNEKFMKINADIMTPNMMTDILSNNRVFITDCFEYYQKTKFMKGENKMYCNVCKKDRETNFKTKIFTPPNIMILILDRGDGFQYNVGLDFLPSIDITQYIDNNYAKGEKAEYDLYAVLTYVGESEKAGHYIAFCKSHDKYKKWICYNDNHVAEIIDFISQIHNYGTPYALFYERK